MNHKLWETESGNLVEDHATETEALAAARDLIGLKPSAYPNALALVGKSLDGGLTGRLEGPELTRRPARAKRPTS